MKHVSVTLISSLLQLKVVCMRAREYWCVCVRVYACLHVCMCVCVYVILCADIYIDTFEIYI